MAGRTTPGGKGDRDRVTDRETFEDNFDKAFPNAFVPSWKRKRKAAEATEQPSGCTTKQP